MISDTKLDFWIKNNYNILIEGRHGTGKSSIIIEAFNKANLKWKYFSAATMDPWVDFIGVPKEKQDPDGTSYLELVRPIEFQRDEIEALFFDEFNRSKAKVRNAVLELIQFKSINGKKFKNLKMIWAAINPKSEDDEYDVEELDPSQVDRFHMHVKMPYKPHKPYFESLYGKKQTQSAIEWWKQLPKEIQNKVSPRRLDYALDVFNKDGDIRDVLPKKSNASKLISILHHGSFTQKLKKLYQQKKEEETCNFLQNENYYSSSIDDILANDDYISYFIPLIEKEKMIALMSKHLKIRDFAVDNYHLFKDVIDDIVEANRNKTLARYIKRKIGIQQICLPKKETYECVRSPNSIVLSSFGKSSMDYPAVLNSIKSLDNSIFRETAYRAIEGNISEKIKKAEAVKTLEILSGIICRSQRVTLRKLTKLMGIINHCLDELYDYGFSDLRDLHAAYPQVGRAIDFGMKKHKSFYYYFEKKKIDEQVELIKEEEVICT